MPSRPWPQGLQTSCACIGACSPGLGTIGGTTNSSGSTAEVLLPSSSLQLSGARQVPARSRPYGRSPTCPERCCWAAVLLRLCLYVSTTITLSHMASRLTMPASVVCVCKACARMRVRALACAVAFGVFRFHSAHVALNTLPRSGESGGFKKGAVEKWHIAKGWF